VQDTSLCQLAFAVLGFAVRAGGRRVASSLGMPLTLAGFGLLDEGCELGGLARMKRGSFMCHASTVPSCVRGLIALDELKTTLPG
jgi:hypothetical protein